MTASASDYPFGYCTNVHAGISLAQAKENLQRIAMQVRQAVSPGGRLPVGLWLTEVAAEQLARSSEQSAFRHWLDEHHLKAYTFNGFPQGDFHQPVVKHAVYEPTWLDQRRCDYTCRLADILAALLDEGNSGSISTLPLGWPHQPWSVDDYRRAGNQLSKVADHLHRISETTGHEIVLALEPEPGCVIDTAVDMSQFLTRYVYASDNGDIARRHICVCHDICHSAVMFEPQEDALQLYAKEGIRIGKVQVSSAVEIPWHAIESTQKPLAFEQLRMFNEPRYLHQTTRRSLSGNGIEMAEDLPQALNEWLKVESNGTSIESTSGSYPTEPWRTHFHVPIYVCDFGLLRATQSDIREVLRVLHTLRSHRVANRPWFTGDFEVETYAWGVLPPALAVPDLAQGIAKELQFFQDELRRCLAMESK